jgi:hypothetical protein
VTDDGLNSALAASVDGCWERLEDVTSGRLALRGVALESIVDRVRQVVAAERAEGRSRDAG